MLNDIKIALIHDWLDTFRGGEKVLQVFCELFPKADIYTIVNFNKNFPDLITNRCIKTSFIQRLPFAKKFFRYYLPLFPAAIERFDLKDYDLIISISHCVAKGIKRDSKICQICYCLTPMRYLWEFPDQYLSKENSHWLARKITPQFFDYLKKWDLDSTSRVDYFIAISNNVANRIKRCYNRESTVIYPTFLDTDTYTINNNLNAEGKYFLVVSALVPYKRIDIAVDAFNELRLPLKIAGTGPLDRRLRKKAGSNIEFLGAVDERRLVSLYQDCKAIIFPGEEDFGLVPIEVQLCGKPVIAYGKGGVLETVVDKQTGVFFPEQNRESLIAAIEEFLNIKFDSQKIRAHTLAFADKENFINKLKDFIEDKYKEFSKNKSVS